MAEPLKNQYGLEVPQKVAASITKVFPSFKQQEFLNACRTGYEQLELMDRGRHIGRVLAEFLPASYPQAIQILTKSLGPPLEKTAGNGLATFFYLPHTVFVREYGLSHPQVSFEAMHAVTQRFTAEFCIRPYLEQHLDFALHQLLQWADDPSVHVRRLVSEGTRPRLPWAERLQCSRNRPELFLTLLEKLKDDPEIYVRKSVSNHLNDISKDHPDLALKVAKNWLKKATPQRQWIVEQGLRTLIKQGHPGPFELLGLGNQQLPQLTSLRLQPQPVHIGQQLSVELVLINRSDRELSAIVDLRVYFCKANGALTPKTFKVKKIQLAPATELVLKKSISMENLSTRKHYPGQHRLELLVNGQVLAEQEFPVRSH